MIEEEVIAVKLAGLIRAGHTTTTARKEMGIGQVKGQRVRAVAVKMGLLRPHEQTHHT